MPLISSYDPLSNQPSVGRHKAREIRININIPSGVPSWRTPQRHRKRYMSITQLEQSFIPLVQYLQKLMLSDMDMFVQSTAMGTQYQSAFPTSPCIAVHGGSGGYRTNTRQLESICTVPYITLVITAEVCGLSSTQLYSTFNVQL